MPGSKRKKPFLHIQQAEIQVPIRHMQEVYHSRKKEKKKQDKPELLHVNEGEENLSQEKKQLQNADLDANVERHPDLAVNEEIKEEATESIDKEKERSKESSPFLRHQEKKSGPTFQRLKSFKEMNILERLDYLINFPKQLIPVSCQFETEDQSIRGFLVNKTEESIEVRKHDGDVITIDIKSLKEVKMLGMRR